MCFSYAYSMHKRTVLCILYALLANEACSPSFSLVSKGVEQFILQKPHKTFCQEFRRSASDAATMIMCLWQLLLATTHAGRVSRIKLALLLLWLRCCGCPLEKDEAITCLQRRAMGFISWLSGSSHAFTLSRRQREYSIHVPLHIHIHTWQQPPSNHLLANHVLCPRRNLEVSALVTPRVFLEGNEPFSSLNTLALPLSAAVIPALHSSWLSCFGRGLSVGMKTTMCLKILETCLAKRNFIN